MARSDVPTRACVPTNKWRMGRTKTLQKSACSRPKDGAPAYPQSKHCIHWAIICVTRGGLEITNPYAPLHPACSPHPAVQSNMVYLPQLHSWLLPALCGRQINADCWTIPVLSAALALLKTSLETCRCDAPCFGACGVTAVRRVPGRHHDWQAVVLHGGFWPSPRTAPVGHY